MRIIRTIFVHCLATQPTGWFAELPNDEKLREVERWHKKRGFRAIGYHYLILLDGSVEAGRPVAEVGAGVSGHNADSIHVALEGGFGSSATDAPEEHFTRPQLTSLRRLIERLRAEHPISKVRGHNEVAPKACPGFNVSKFLKGKPAKPSPTDKVVEATVKAGPVGGIGGLSVGATAQSFAGWDGNAQVILAVALAVLACVVIWRYAYG